MVMSLGVSRCCMRDFNRMMLNRVSPSCSGHLPLCTSQNDASKFETISLVATAEQARETRVSCSDHMHVKHPAVKVHSRRLI